MLGQVRRDGWEPVGEAGDGLPGDREVFEMGLGLPQPVLQFADLRAEVVAQGPGGVLLDAERFAAERAIELPASADLKAYTARSAATVEAAQALLAAKFSNPEGRPKGPVYGLLLVSVGVDRMHLDDLISYLAAASRKVRDGDT
ncbi:hypothetical protein ACFY5H_33340 [Streptomyces sp. NPDC013012]|uniref:hypothetical protein n=1 Tax=Streptomyces sp. NPDC013012 TaxID=3364860 RepID=UPI003691495F